MDLKSTYLFVYGTLCRASGHAMADYVVRRGRFLGPGRVPGRLYDLGRYPGLVASAQEREWVQGEVYALAEPEETLAMLDRYEACDPDDRSAGLFDRRCMQVVMDAGETYSCWMYYYCGPVEEENRIFSGDYCASRRRSG
jgi:gamma-glutamylcyclotransferase (GGCT)/AIG2-like uncharacterized protein YtfP